MTLTALIEEFQDQEHEVVVYRGDDQLEIEPWLATHGVTVESRSLPAGGPDPFIEIRTAGEVVGIIGVEAVEALLEPPIHRPGNRDEISAGYRSLFDILENTVLSGMNRRELLAVSREIEDRAYRVGAGTMWVSFQTLSIFRTQARVYRTLGTETDLEINVFGLDDWSPPTIDGITYHTREAAAFEPYWAIAFDGGPDETQACGLVAEEDTDGYTGFWTNDAATVESIASTFETA